MDKREGVSVPDCVAVAVAAAVPPELAVAVGVTRLELDGDAVSAAEGVPTPLAPRLRVGVALADADVETEPAPLLVALTGTDAGGRVPLPVGSCCDAVPAAEGVLEGVLCSDPGGAGVGVAVGDVSAHSARPQKRSDVRIKLYCRHVPPREVVARGAAANTMELGADPHASTTSAWKPPSGPVHCAVA